MHVLQMCHPTFKIKIRHRERKKSQCHNKTLTLLTLKPSRVKRMTERLGEFNTLNCQILSSNHSIYLPWHIICSQCQMRNIWVFISNHAKSKQLVIDTYSWRLTHPRLGGGGGVAGHKPVILCVHVCMKMQNKGDILSAQAQIPPPPPLP